MRALFFAAAFLLFNVGFGGAAFAIDENQDVKVVKEWTFLVFLNGHNNLDPFGDMNMEQMKSVGSNANLNVVVQWASAAKSTTSRVYVEKNNIRVIENMGRRADMGDYRELVEFVRWAKEKYPSKKYFIDIWNHGAGWKRLGRPEFRNISNDDFTGNDIKTEELKTAFGEIQQILGQKVDLFGADACLMAMAEVASEVSDHVSIFAGSQDLEPGEGWPYAKLLEWWKNNPTAEASAVGLTLADEFFKAYQEDGVYGEQDVTFSIMDLNKWDALQTAWKTLSEELIANISASKDTLKTTFTQTESYFEPSYGDLKQFIDKLEVAFDAARIQHTKASFKDVRTAFGDVVLATHADDIYQAGNGLSIWVPSQREWRSLGGRYSNLTFSKATNWDDVLRAVYP